MTPKKIKQSHLSAIEREKMAKTRKNIEEFILSMVEKIDEVEEKDPFDNRLPGMRQDFKLRKEEAEQKTNMITLYEMFDSKTFVIAYRPDVVYGKYISLSTEKKALNAKSISLQNVNKTLGKGTAENWLMIFIEDAFRKTGMKLDEIGNIDFLAQEIYSKNQVLTLPEVVLCFRWIVTGQFGKLYNKVTPLNICPCFDEYRKKRLAAIEQIDRENNETKNINAAMGGIAEMIKHLPDGSFSKKLLQKSSPKVDRKQNIALAGLRDSLLRVGTELARDHDSEKTSELQKLENELKTKIKKLENKA